MVTSALSWISALLCFSFFLSDTNEHGFVESRVYHWDSLPIEQVKTGENRAILHGKTTVFEELEIHSTTINPGKTASLNSNQRDFEKLIIVKEGEITHSIGKSKKILGPGSVALIMPGDKYKLTNTENTSATFYCLSWKTNGFLRKTTSASSTMVDWNDVAFTQTSKGGKRQILNHPTTMFDEFEMHVTTLNKGMKSHDQHTHIDEEIILVIKGEVEELIDGKPLKAKTGDLIFLQSNIPHGIRNIGDGPCEYFAFKWINK